MPLNIRQANKFKRDIKRLGKQGRDLSEIQSVIKTLAVEKPLSSRYRVHKLSGDWKDHRECHIKPDWLLIYRVDRDVLELVRTGSHADLFMRPISDWFLRSQRQHLAKVNPQRSLRPLRSMFVC